MNLVVFDLDGAESAEAFRETPGASTLLEALQQSHWAVAIATGSFEQPARFKMKAACLAIADVPADLKKGQEDESLWTSRRPSDRHIAEAPA